MGSKEEPTLLSLSELSKLSRRSKHHCSHVAGRSGDAQLRDILKPAADEVELKDVHHLNQTAEEMAKLSLTFMYE
jgi:hypothetical protein